MSDDDKKPDVRRIGRKDRKPHIDSSPPLFPESESTEDAEQGEQPADDSTPQNDDSHALPTFDLEGETVLAEPLEFGNVEKVSDVDVPGIHIAAVIAKEHNPTQVTPPEERFPPLNPAAEDAQPPKPQTQVTPKGRKRRVGNWRHDLIAFMFLIATIGMCGYYATLWNDPYSALNPLAPPTPFVVVTATPDLTQAAVFYATETAVAQPTPTLTPTITTTVDVSTATPQALAFPFTLSVDVLYTPNSNGRGCDWASIAGTVTDLNGAPINNFGIQITDATDPTLLDERVFSGSALTFGDGGFELSIGSAPREGQYIVQLFSPAGVPVSDEFLVITSAECEQNVVIITFTQTSPM